MNLISRRIPIFSYLFFIANVTLLSCVLHKFHDYNKSIKELYNNYLSNLEKVEDNLKQSSNTRDELKKINFSLIIHKLLVSNDVLLTTIVIDSKIKIVIEGKANNISIINNYIGKLNNNEFLLKFIVEDITQDSSVTDNHKFKFVIKAERHD